MNKENSDVILVSFISKRVDLKNKKRVIFLIYKKIIQYTEILLAYLSERPE